MTINHTINRPTDQATNHPTKHSTDPVTRTARTARPARSRTIATAGAIVFVGTTVALGAIALSDDHPAQQPDRPAPVAPERANRVTPEDLVQRGLIPRESLDPAPQWHTDVLRDLVERDLVERGWIPRESLDPAPQWHTDVLRDLAERDLVERGLIPRQSLDPAPTLAPPAG